MMTKDINNSQQKLVVLIDADNASPSIIYGLMSEIAKYGTSHVKRIYGDWTSPNLKGWKELLLEHALQPVQQFGYTKGKNSTDSAMIIDAMDLLYSGKFDGFCIVSSDSDFTRLLSIYAGITDMGTIERIEHLERKKLISEELATQAIIAFDTITETLINEQVNQAANNQEVTSYISPASLSLFYQEKLKRALQFATIYTSYGVKFLNEI